MLSRALPHDSPHRHLGWAMGASGALVALAVVVVLVDAFRLWQPASRLAGPALVFVLVASGLGAPALMQWSLVAARDARARVLRVRCRLCVWCGHDLSGRPATNDTCPECGRRIATRDAAILWCRRLSRPDRA